MRKLRPLRDLVFELFLSEDRQKRGLFAQFDAEKQRLKANKSSEGGDGGDYDHGAADGRGGDPGGGDDRFDDLFGVMQRLGIIAEEMSAIDAGGGDPAAAAAEAAAAGDSPEDAEAEEGSAERTGTATADMSSVLAWAFWRTSGGGATINGGGATMRGRRGLPSRTGSVRFSRRGRGFFRDAGQQGEDDWGTLTGAAPNLAPRILPPEWTSGSISNAEPQPPSSAQGTPTPGAAAGPLLSSSQLSVSNRSGGGGISESIRSGGGGGGGNNDSLRSTTSRRRELSDSTGGGGGGGRSFATSSDRGDIVGRGHRRDSSIDSALLDSAAGLSATEGAAATAAASAMLSSRSLMRRPRAGLGAGASWSSRSVLSGHREGSLGEGKAARGAKGKAGEPPSMAGGGGGDAGPARGSDAPRLQLSDHGVRRQFSSL